MEDFKSNGLSFSEGYSEKFIERENIEAYEIAKELIKKLFVGMSKRSTKFCNDTYNMCDLPYLYSERCLDSVFLPELSRLCESMVFTEVPVRRKLINTHNLEKKERRGRIDYWCIYKNYSFIFELKHSFDCFKTEKIRERKVSEPWETMIDQVRSVTKYARNCEESTKGVIRIGLHIIVSYSDEKRTPEMIKEFRENVPNIAARFMKKIGKNTSRKPDMILCWKIPKSIIFKYYQTFPGLWALAKIYPPIRHRGAE